MSYEVLENQLHSANIKERVKACDVLLEDLRTLEAENQWLRESLANIENYCSSFISLSSSLDDDAKHIQGIAQRALEAKQTNGKEMK